MAFLRAVLFILTAAAIIALGANELHREYKRSGRDAFGRSAKSSHIGKEIHDNVAVDRAIGKARRPASQEKERTEAKEFHKELSREDRSQLNQLLDKVVQDE